MDKICLDCKIEKEISCFRTENGKYCWDCLKLRRKQTQEKYKKAHYNEIKEKNKEHRRKKPRLGSNLNWSPEKQEYDKKYKKERSAKIKEYQQEYHKKNKTKRNLYKKTYNQKNKEKIKEKRRLMERERWANDPLYVLRKLVSHSIRQYIKKLHGIKTHSSWSILPYSPQQLKEHLEKQFEEWMSWENYRFGKRI